MAVPPSSAGKGENMVRLVTATVGVLAFALSVNVAMAQDKAKADKGAPKSAMKVITENDKVKVYEVTYVPGAENTAVATSATRVVRSLKGGTLERRYADGKKETVEWKPGMVQVLPPQGAYTTKNVGKSEIQLYVVQLK
jgi:hypothetical protein